MLKLKLDDAGHVVVQDGKPVYVDEDGKDRVFDAAATLAKIGQLNKEAQSHREAKEAAEAKLTVFADLDPEAAKKALETVANLSSGDLKTAAQVEEIKANATKAAEQRVEEGLKTIRTQLEKVSGERDSLFKAFSNEKISNAFATSKFIQEKLTLPAPAVQKIFGDAFGIEDGKIVAKGPDGRPIISKKNPGDLADPEEAIELLVDSYSFRDSIIKGSGGGSGGTGGGAGGKGDGRTITRAAFERLNPTERVDVMGKGTQIVDG